MATMTKTPKRETPPPAEPEVLLSFPDLPEWQAAQSKLHELAAHASRLQARAVELNNQLHSAANHRRNVGPIDAAAERLLANRPDEPAPPPEPPLREELARVTRDAEVARRAIALQQGAIERLRAELSPQIARQYVPEHRRLVADIGRHLAGLAAALRAEVRLHEDLDAQGVSNLGTLPPAAIPVLTEQLLDRTGILSAWFSDMVSRGLLDPAAPDLAPLRS